MLVALVSLALSFQAAPQSNAVPSAPPVSQDAAQGPTTTAVAEVPVEARARMVCRDEVVVGTRFSTRICNRQDHLAARQRDSRALQHRLDVQNSNKDRIYAPGR